MNAPDSHRRLGLVAVIIVVVLALVTGRAGATGSSTITFSEHPAGTVIDAEYASQGVRFGKAGEVGAPALAGAWDCGAPQVKELPSDGTPSKLAQAPICGGRSGTVAAFANPRKTIRLLVGATPSTDRDAEVLAYDRQGVLLTRTAAVARPSTIAIERPTPDVSFLAVQLEGEGTSTVLFDDLVFDHLGDPLMLAPRGIGATVNAERTDNVARLTDADPTATAADYTVTIEWGDGQASGGRVAQSGDGYDVVGPHTYATTGTFSVRTTVSKVNGVRATVTSTARVVDRADFAASVTPSSASVRQGASGRYTVAVTPLAGFSGNVTLALGGATGNFVPSTVSVPGTSQLTVATSAATAPGSYPLTITATSGSLSRTVSATLTVTKAAPVVTAKLAAPRRAAARSLLVLDARGTTGASRYLWDVSGDRRPDVACGAKTPLLGVRLRTPGRRTVSLTAVAGNGDTAVQLRTLAIRKRPGVGGRFTEVATCLRDARPYLLGRACAERVVFGVVEAKGCFMAQGDSLVAHGLVKLNGVSFVPSPGATVVLVPQLEKIVSTSATVALGPIPVREAKAGPFDLPLSGTAAPRPAGRTLGKRYPRVNLFAFTVKKSLPALGGFSLNGGAEVSLVKKGASYLSETKVQLELPSVFSLVGGPPPTGATLLEADNDRGLVLDELHASVPEAYLGAIRMTNLSFEFKARGNAELNCPRRWWKATASVFLGSTGRDAGFRLAPDPSLNGIAFCDGKFKSAGGELVFGAQIPPPQLFPGVFLKKVNFGIGLGPTVVTGGATVTAADLTEVSGRVLMAFASRYVPYLVRPGDAGRELAVLANRVFFDPLIAVGGDFGFPIGNLGRISFAGGYFGYVDPGYFFLGGNVRIPAPGLAFNAGVEGELSVRNRLFSFHGFGEVCIAGLACVLRGEGWVTSTGVVACLTIAGELHPGAGLRWGSAWPEIWLVDGCTPSPYWPDLRAKAFSLSAFGATAATSFTVARGERAKNVRLNGVGGAPRVEVRAPGGELVSTAAGDFASGKTIRILRQEAGKVTWIGVENGAPGTYTVTTLPGSAGIAGLAATREHDDHLRVTVVGKGAARALRYDIARVPGRRVTFFERGRSSYQRLGAVTGGKAQLRFAPAPGASGLRKIVAHVELAGVPTPERVVARYRLAPPSRLVRPAALRVSRSGSSVVVRWARVQAASRYALVLRLRSGAQRLIRVPPRRPTVRLSGVPATQAGSVTVRALDVRGAWGPAASGRFAAQRRQPSAFRPFAELRRKRRQQAVSDRTDRE